MSLVTGGSINPATPLQDRRAAKQERRALKREYKDEKRMARGKAPRGPRRSKGQRKGGVRKLLTQDVLYLLVVNLPTEEEVQRSVADLEKMVSGDVNVSKA